MTIYRKPLGLIAVVAILTSTPAFAGLEIPTPDETSLSGSYLAGRYAGKLRDMDIAAQYFALALRDDPNNPVLIEKAFLLELSAGNVPKAEDLAVQVVSFNDQHRMARIVLGLRDFRLKHFSKAREQFKKSAYTPIGELTSGLLTAWAWAGEGNLK